MPLKLEKGKNPYVCNYFGKLRVGPNMRPAQIAQQARNLVQRIASGEEVSCAAGHPLDEHAVNEASNKLREPRALAEELLLVHPQPQQEGAKKTRDLVARLREKATIPKTREPIPLRHPAAIFWFTPAPGPEAVELPGWEAFGLVACNDAEDLALDIVFDR
jgi:hypothetical protein